MAVNKKARPSVKTLLSLTVVALATLAGPAGQPGRAAAQAGPIVLDGNAGSGEWDAAWQVATDPLDVFITSTGVHPHQAPTFARSGYDAISLWAYYDVAGETWYFRLDVDGRAGDSDSQIGTAGNLGVGTHGNDAGPLVEVPFIDGDGLGTSESYRLGFQYTGGRSATTVIGPGATLLPGAVIPTTDGLPGTAAYGTSVPGVIEFALDGQTLFPSGGDPESELWLSAQLGDNQDTVSDDSVPLVLLTSLDLTASCSASTAIIGQQVTLPVDYAISGSARLGAHDVVLSVPVPAGTSFVGATHGGTESGGVVTWNLGDLQPGATGQVFLTLQVNDPLSRLPIHSEIACAEGLRDVSTIECAVLAPTPTPTPTPTSTPTPTPTETPPIPPSPPAETATPTPTSTRPLPPTPTSTLPPVVPTLPPPGPPPTPPPVIPEASSLVLLGSAVTGLAGYAALQLRARRRK